MRDRPDLDALERRLGYAFVDRSRLLAALTHRSAAYETDLEEDYERFEFLGDAVLGLIAAERVFRDLPESREGELTRLKSRFVSASALLGYAGHLGLGEFLVLGLGEERSGGRRKDSLLADSMEAVFGAVYLDGGLEAAVPVVTACLDFLVARGSWEDERDAKSALQERLQAVGVEVPVYRVVIESGPDHSKTFTVEAVVEGQVAGVGSGGTKKAAERAAAAAALRDGDWEEAYNRRP